MPYRRLPNTDASRIRALEIILEKDHSSEGYHSLPPMPLEQRARFFLPRFKTAIINSHAAREQQIAGSQKFNDYTQKSRLYISHFLQVLNFSIIRGELKPSARTYYGIEEDNSKLPSLVSEQDLLEWGEKVIKGEQERIGMGGGTPIYNPSIALVKVNFENFKQARFSQHQFQVSASRFSHEVARLRNEADEIILKLWNAIEEQTLSIADEQQRREICENFGIVYVFRKGEREKIARKKEAERITLELPFT